MVFVHARNATVRTATALRDLASSRGDLPHFQPEQTSHLGLAEKQVRTLPLFFSSLLLLPSFPPSLLFPFFLTFTSLSLSLSFLVSLITFPLSTSSFLSSLHFSPITLSFPPPHIPCHLLPFSLLSSPFSLFSRPPGVKVS